jgi:hypothetical protein
LCSNTEGSFKCGCDEGKVLNEDGVSCNSKFVSDCYI